MKIVTRLKNQIYLLAVVAAFVAGPAFACDIEEFAGWAVSPYQTPTCRLQSNQLSVNGETAPSGLFFVKKFDQPSNLNIAVSGKSDKGQATMRVRVNNADPVYHLAPNGETVLSHSDVSEIEILIYADTPFAYMLEGIDYQAGFDFSKITKEKSLDDVFSLTGKTGHPLETGVYVHGKTGVNATYSNLVYSDDGSGGAWIRLELKGPSRIYFTGRQIHGKSTLRIIDEQTRTRQFFPLDQRETMFFAEDGGKFEFLVFSEAAFVWQLDEIRVEACLECGTNARLKERIKTDMPGIEEMIANRPLDGARQLLDWVSVNGDWTEDSVIERRSYPVVRDYSAGYAFFELFEKNKGGVFCGGLAVFYNKVLHLFGYDSFVIDFGDNTGSLTHISTLIAYPDSEGVIRYYMFDTMLNSVFRFPEDDRYMDVMSILDSLLETGTVSLGTHSLPVTERDWHIVSANENSNWHQCEVVVKENGPERLCRVPSFTVASFLAGVKNAWAGIGLAPEMQSLMKLMTRRIFSVSYPSNPDSLNRFIEQVQQRNIPYGYPT